MVCRSIAIILVRPRTSGNLGAIARLARNFGLDDVRLVAPVASIDDDEALRFATSEARDLLARFSHYERLADAVADRSLVVATTSTRRRERRGIESITELPRSLAPDIDLGLVFGPEDHGLDNEEIDLAQRLVTIPANPEHPVLNLSHAVALALYELRRAEQPSTSNRSAESTPATSADWEAMFEQLRRALIRASFLDPNNPERIERDLRRMLTRAAEDQRDVQIWRGIARQIGWLADLADRPDSAAD